MANPSVRNKNKVDSVMRVHSPRVAAIRSAIIPGWGQIYNKRIWKVPIVYGALGTTAGIFFYNLNNYKDFRQAVMAMNDVIHPNTPGYYYDRDSTKFKALKPYLQQIAIISGYDRLRFYRDDFRRNVDYSVLFFLVFWGLNVVDATVDAHLRAFDVSPDLSLKINIGHSQLANTNGLSLILAFK